ncbi:UNVERIFIED_CONTAM: Polygalacturonase [Sesamum radiatum]|uniref:Polygalacturonase n=1 Tax=Sesamum radiatum TaxID=300843 RepID=A0AAW2NBL1_SESRA
MMLILIFTSFYYTSSFASNPSYNVKSFGAMSDGESDSTKAFLSAWSAACATTQPAAIYVPPGRYLLRNAFFNGKTCKNKAITIRIDGTLVAPSDYNTIGNSGTWLKFQKVTGVSISGGTLDGQGTKLWACKNSSKSCPKGATSSGVTITNSRIGTGDDCVSVGPGTSNLWIENLSCGPGHGISIGSLGWDLQEAGVENVTVKTATFSGTENGVRVKSWARPSNGFVKHVLFQHIVIVNAQNPIIIDQHYCPDRNYCPTQVSGVKISDITYEDVHGTSATEVAVKFDCSKSNPCTGITLDRVNLTYGDKPAIASCAYAGGTASADVEPNSCL